MKKFALLLFVAGILMVSCKSSSNKSSKHIIMPDSMELYNPHLSSLPAKILKNQTPAKIYTLVDVSCSTCIFKLEQWNKFQQELNYKKATVIPVCYAKDGFELLKYLFESKKLKNVKIPLYLDSKQKFIQANQGQISKSGVLNILTDAEGRVLAEGDPIDDAAVRSHYINLINNL
jgi:hypothetical protein